MKRSKIVLVFALALGMLGLGAVSYTVTAAPPSMVETTYYSDAAHSNEVGFRIRMCSGRTITHGTVTIYKEVSSEPCM